MPYPHQPYGTATSPEPMSFLDDTFNGIAAGTSIPCTTSGGNAINLTPLAGFPALTSYTELMGFRFVASFTSTGVVTAQYNGLGFFPVYHADGTTQFNVADIVAGQQYIFTFHQALNGGLGGFFGESPSLPTAAATWFTPGGRLTQQSAVPVNFASGVSGILYYAPYVHPFVPIYNGAGVQMYQITSSLSDQVGLTLNLAGSASWPNNNAFDVFVTLVSGVPTLATVQWTSLSARALALSVFAGFLTNSGTVTMRTAPGTTVSVVANQGTFLGSFTTVGGSPGNIVWTFPGANQAGSFNICNYYNPVLFTGQCQDTNAAYTYTSTTVRQARASVTNQISLLQCSSERACRFTYLANIATVNAVNATGVTGIGINNTTAFAPGAISQFADPAGVSQLLSRATSVLDISFTGFETASANEGSDGTNANTFNQGQINTLSFAAWL
jgi:hypothetical protein